MVEEEIIQTLSILSMSFGSIIAIEGLWKRGLDKTIKKTESILKAYDEAIKKLELLVEEKIKKVSKKLPKQKNFRQFLKFILSDNIFNHLFLMRARIHSFYKTMIFFRKYLVHIGVVLIAIGTVLQLLIMH